VRYFSTVNPAYFLWISTRM